MNNCYQKVDAETWRDAVEHEMRLRGDTWDSIVDVVAADGFFQSTYYFDYNPPRPAFTIWTEGHVYFATLYDGYVGVGSVPRNPCKIRSLNEDGTTQFYPDKYRDPLVWEKQELAP